MSNDEIDRCGKVSTEKFDQIHKIETSTDLEIWLDTFSKCYVADDPQGPYGDQTYFLPVLRRAWLANRDDDELGYFLIYDGGRPVGAACLTVRENIAYLSGGGTLPDVRGQGFGKAMAYFRVQKAIKRGATEICLATEKGGFRTNFINAWDFDRVLPA